MATFVYNKQNTTPSTIPVTETPKIPFIGKWTPAAEWTNWFSNITTWVKSASDMKQNLLKNGDTEIGIVYMNRIGPYINVHAEIDSVAISEGTRVTGLTVKSEIMSKLDITSVDNNNIAVAQATAVVLSKSTELVFPQVDAVSNGKILITGQYLALRTEDI